MSTRRTPARTGGEGRGPSSLLIVSSVILAMVVLAAIAVVTLGLVRLPGFGNSARPPCERLPPAAAVEEALATNAPLVARIEQVGAGVAVAVSRPCGDTDRALVRITVASGQERAGVDAILRQDGFGTPVELIGG